MYIIGYGVDFLKVSCRVEKNNYFLNEYLRKLYCPLSYSDLKGVLLSWKSGKYDDEDKREGDYGKYFIVFDDFIGVYAGNFKNNLLKRFYIYDRNNVVIMKVDVSKSLFSDESVFFDCDFYSYFFSYYKEYFIDFLDLLGIDDMESGIVKRVDYCVDFLDVSVSSFFDMLNSKMKGKKVKKFEVGGVCESFSYSFSGMRKFLRVYDKKKEIKEGKEFTADLGSIGGKFLQYSQLEKDITRIEISYLGSYFSNCKRLKRIVDGSIMSVFSQIKDVFIGDVLKYFVGLSKLSFLGDFGNTDFLKGIHFGIPYYAFLAGFSEVDIVFLDVNKKRILDMELFEDIKRKSIEKFFGIPVDKRKTEEEKIEDLKRKILTLFKKYYKMKQNDIEELEKFLLFLVDSLTGSMYSIKLEENYILHINI